jgi:hypothetical protein
MLSRTFHGRHILERLSVLELFIAGNEKLAWLRIVILSEISNVRQETMALFLRAFAFFFISRVLCFEYTPLVLMYSGVTTTILLCNACLTSKVGSLVNSNVS